MADPAPDPQISAFIDGLRRRGFTLRSADGKLMVSNPTVSLSEDERLFIRTHKMDILETISRDDHIYKVSDEAGGDTGIPAANSSSTGDLNAESTLPPAEIGHVPVQPSPKKLNLSHARPSAAAVPVPENSSTVPVNTPPAPGESIAASPGPAGIAWRSAIPRDVMVHCIEKEMITWTPEHRQACQDELQRIVAFRRARGLPVDPPVIPVSQLAKDPGSHAAADPNPDLSPGPVLDVILRRVAVWPPAVQERFRSLARAYQHPDRGFGVKVRALSPTAAARKAHNEIVIFCLNQEPAKILDGIQAEPPARDQDTDNASSLSNTNPLFNETQGGNSRGPSRPDRTPAADGAAFNGNPRQTAGPAIAPGAPDFPLLRDTALNGS